MKKIVESLGKKFDVDLQQSGAHLRLNMPHFDRLVIERLSPTQLSVAHYFELNGDLCAEPDIVFFIDGDGNFIPYEIQSVVGGYQVHAELDNGTLKITNTEKQKDLADFTNTWAENIKIQGWLEDACKHLSE